MTSPSPEPRCRKEGCGLPLTDGIHQFYESGAPLQVDSHLFLHPPVAPQEPATPRAEITNAEWNPTVSLPSGHMITGGQFVPSRLDGEPRDPTLECGCASSKAVFGYRYSLSCCPNGRSHGPACTCGATFAAAVGDTETPPAAAPLCPSCGNPLAHALTICSNPFHRRAPLDSEPREPTREVRVTYCDCWTRGGGATCKACAPQETPEGEPPLGTCNMDSAFHAKTCGCLDWTPNRSAYSVTEATYLLRSDNTRLEDALAAMTKARDLWKQYADANLARTQELAADLATQTRSLAALRSAVEYYADQRKKFPRSGAEITAFQRMMDTLNGVTR